MSGSSQNCHDGLKTRCGGWNYTGAPVRNHKEKGCCHQRAGVALVPRNTSGPAHWVLPRHSGLPGEFSMVPTIQFTFGMMHLTGMA